jgi:hypothetical protein
MNERIKQLLSQAGVHYEVVPKDTVYEKFAELIVKEVESYIEEAEGDIELVQFLIDRYLK